MRNHVAFTWNSLYFDLIVRGPNLAYLKYALPTPLS